MLSNGTQRLVANAEYLFEQRISINKYHYFVVEWNRVITRPDQGNDYFISEFSIANSASSDEGVHECTATNIYGEDSDAVFLQVQGMVHSINICLH